MEGRSKKLTKSAWSWAFYDWANSAFATTVMAGFFPLFFKSFWATDLSAIESTAVIGTTNSLSGVFIMVLAPILGAYSDLGKLKKIDDKHNNKNNNGNQRKTMKINDKSVKIVEK